MWCFQHNIIDVWFYCDPKWKDFGLELPSGPPSCLQALIRIPQTAPLISCTVWKWLDFVLSAPPNYQWHHEHFNIDISQTRTWFFFFKPRVMYCSDFKRYSQSHLQVSTVAVIMRWRWISVGPDLHILLALPFIIYEWREIFGDMPD